MIVKSGLKKMKKWEYKLVHRIQQQTSNVSQEEKENNKIYGFGSSSNGNCGLSSDEEDFDDGELIFGGSDDGI